MSIRHITPTLRIGQRTTITREIQLREAGHSSAPLDLTDAESVTLTLEHYEFAFTAIQGGECTIVTPSEGIVSYTFDQADTSLHGRYSMQFEVTWSDGSTELVPPSREEWVMDIGRRQPKYQPLEVPSITADEGVIGDLQANSFSAGTAEIGEIIGDPTIDSLSMNTLDVGALEGGVVGTRGPLTRIDGPDLQVNVNGELEWVDPNTGGFTAGSDHDHSATGEGGDMLRPLSVTTDKIQTSRAETAEADSTTLNKIYLESDTYTVSGGISVSGNTIIDGQGATIQIADLADFWGGVFTIGNASNVTIENVTIDLNKSGASTTTSHVYNLGIYTTDTATAANVTLRDVTIRNGVNRGIALYDCENVQLENVLIENCNEGQLEIDHTCKAVEVSNSTFRSNEATPGFGVRLDASSDRIESIAVTDSYIEGVSRGVSIDGAAHQSVRIADNTIADCGIGVRVRHHGTASDNTILRCNTAIEATNGTDVMGNTIAATMGADAIKVAQGGATVKNNTILGGHGNIDCSGGTNTVTNNTIRHVNRRGMEFYGSENRIANNRITLGSGATTLSADAAAGAETISLGSLSPFVPGEYVNIDGEERYILERVESAKNGSANIVRLDSALVNAHAMGAPVEATTSRTQIAYVGGDDCILTGNDLPDLHDNGARNLVNGRDDNTLSTGGLADPRVEGEWFGHAARAEEYNALIIGSGNKRYRAIGGSFVALDDVRIETGEVTADGLDNSTGTNGWGQSVHATVSVPFDTAFSAPPKVVVSPAEDIDNVPADTYTTVTNNIYADRFDCRFRVMAAVDHSLTANAYGAKYIAIGPR